MWSYLVGFGSNLCPMCQGYIKVPRRRDQASIHHLLSSPFQRPSFSFLLLIFSFLFNYGLCPSIHGLILFMLEVYYNKDLAVYALIWFLIYSCFSSFNYLLICVLSNITICMFNLIVLLLRYKYASMGFGLNSISRVYA